MRNNFANPSGQPPIDSDDSSQTGFLHVLFARREGFSLASLARALVPYVQWDTDGFTLLIWKVLGQRERNYFMDV